MSEFQNFGEEQEEYALTEYILPAEDDANTLHFLSWLISSPDKSFL